MVVKQLSYGYADLFIQLREELCTSSAVLHKGWILNQGSRSDSQAEFTAFAIVLLVPLA